MRILIVVQHMTDGSIVETGIPISPCNILRWIYETRNPNEIYLTIDVGLGRSVKLSGLEATQSRDFMESGFDHIHTVHKHL